MLSIIHLVPPAPDVDLRAPGTATLEAFARRPGFVRGSLGRATDDVTEWVLVTEWKSVGDYRRALGNFDVKMVATAFLGLAVDRPSGYEQLVSAAAGVPATAAASDVAKSDGTTG